MTMTCDRMPFGGTIIDTRKSGGYLPKPCVRCLHRTKLLRPDFVMVPCATCGHRPNRKSYYTPELSLEEMRPPRPVKKRRTPFDDVIMLRWML